MKPVLYSPSIVQEAFYPNILLLHWNSAGAHDTFGRSCFLDSLEAWEAKNIEAFFVPDSCPIYIFKEARPDYLLFRQGAPYQY